MGREISFKTTERIISLVPSQTELLVDLGLKNQLIGVTKYCVHPKNIRKEIETIGGTKALDLDKIRALKPDLIIANKEENQQDQIESLALEFPVWISDINNLDSAWDMIDRIADLLNKKEIADQLIIECKEKWETIYSGTIRGTCLYFIWQKPYMLAGKDTFIDNVISHIGLENLAHQFEGRYPEISQETIKELNPDYIFLSSEPYPFKEKNLKQMEKIVLDSTVHLVDGEFFSWYGSRLLPAAEYFSKLKNTLNI